jgi:hypothetical protein
MTKAVDTSIRDIKRTPVAIRGMDDADNQKETSLSGLKALVEVFAPVFHISGRPYRDKIA